MSVITVFIAENRKNFEKLYYFLCSFFGIIFLLEILFKFKTIMKSIIPDYRKIGGV